MILFPMSEENSDFLIGFFKNQKFMGLCVCTNKRKRIVMVFEGENNLKPMVPIIVLFL
jgi:hypothetical protein